MIPGLHPTRPRSLSISPLALAFVVLLMSLWPLGPAWAVEVNVTSDRDPVSLEESFNLVFSADEDPDGEPDFSPLNEDFDVLRQGRSTQINMVNGRLTRRAEWTVTVMARQAGDVTVPPIAFGSDNSRPIRLTVLPGRAHRSAGRESAPLQLEVEAEPKNPYVQAQVVLTLRLLHQVALRNGQLEDPKLEDAMIQKLGDDRRYQIERDGRRYGVIERRFAIFPQKSGTLRIEPIGLEAELAGSGNSMFDQFFGGGGRVTKIRSEATILQVRAIPAAFKGKHWLPAASLTLDQAWSSDPPSTKVGEPITRTLSVRGEGVTMGMLPELIDRSAAAAAELKQYPDQPAISEQPGPGGLTGVRREKTALIPMKDGSFKVPGVEIPWWNTRTDKLEVARLPETMLKVLPSPDAPPPPPLPEDELDLSGLAPKTPEPSATAQAPAAQPVPLTANPWFWATCLCAAGWLATGLAWYFRGGRKPAATATKGERAPDFSGTLKQLKRACADGDAEAARRAILAWGAARWPALPPVNLEQMASRLGSEAHPLIQNLNRALYANGKGQWNSEGLYALFADQSRDGAKSKGKSDGGEALEALYRT
ncbi:protein BatD [Methylolobus aquaticus]|nr:protein BatD [Methylolobus aquaticus]